MAGKTAIIGFLLVATVLPLVWFFVAVWTGSPESSQEPRSTRPVVQQPATRPPIGTPKSEVHYAPATPMQIIQSMMHNNPRLKQCVADSGLTDLQGIVVRFEPKPDGTGTSNISLSPAELGGSTLEACVASVMGQMHFPSYDGESTPLTYQLER